MIAASLEQTAFGPLGRQVPSFRRSLNRWFLDLVRMAPTSDAARRLTGRRIGRMLSSHRIGRICAAEVLAILRRPALTADAGPVNAASVRIAAVAGRLCLVSRPLNVTRNLDSLVQQLAGPEADLEQTEFCRADLTSGSEVPVGVTFQALA